MAKGEFDLDEASELLDALINSPPTWGPAVLMLGYIISSAFVAPLFFNGSWTDCWISALFGLAVGLLTYVSEKIPMFGNVFEMVVTIPIAVSAMALQPYVCFPAIVLSSVSYFHNLVVLLVFTNIYIDCHCVTRLFINLFCHGTSRKELNQWCRPFNLCHGIRSFLRFRYWLWLLYLALSPS